LQCREKRLTNELTGERWWSIDDGCEVKCRLDQTTARTPIYILNDLHYPNSAQTDREENEQERANPIDKESERTKRANTTTITTTLVVTRLRETGPPTSPANMQDHAVGYDVYRRFWQGANDFVFNHHARYRHQQMHLDVAVHIDMDVGICANHVW
jgi:hypothetical protein